MMESGALSELEAIVGADALCTDPEELARRTRNTLGLERRILGIVAPETPEQVQAIVQAANRHRIALYPYSRGKNIGYGERLPVGEDNLIVDLGRMDEIIDVDSELGYADVQPGVTQGQLSDHVREMGIPFFIDATGAGRDSSVVGNCVEGGFGTTPRGHKRKEITCVRGVYGNAEIFDTGCFPCSVGPDLAGMFVQSNFGIITQLRIPLNPLTEDYRSYMINVQEQSDLIALIEVLRQLRQEGTFSNQVIITNALDTLGASRSEIPAAYANRTLTNEDARAILSSPLASFGALCAVGAIYGSRAEVRAKRKTARRRLRARLGGRARIRFLSTRSIGFLSRLVSTWPLSKFGPTAKLSTPLRSFQEVHGLMQGIASNDPLIGLLGDVRDTYGDKRLMWYSSRVPSSAKQVARFVEVASGCYRRQGFEYPLEMLLVTPNDIVAIQKIDWQQADPAQETRAWQLYESLSQELKQEGFLPYRLGVQSQVKVVYPEDRARTLQRLKATFDPNGVIAPGRYGIDAAART